MSLVICKTDICNKNLYTSKYIHHMLVCNSTETSILMYRYIFDRVDYGIAGTKTYSKVFIFYLLKIRLHVIKAYLKLRAHQISLSIQQPDM